MEETELINFSNIIKPLENGHIAVVDKESLEDEQYEVVDFCKATKDILGVDGINRHDLKPESWPLLDNGSWDLSLNIETGEKDNKLNVFVLVISNKMIGYVAIDWCKEIRQFDDKILAIDENPLPAKNKMRSYRLKDFLKTDFSNEPKRLEYWSVLGICILPECQRKGLATILFRTALDYLGTNERDIAYDRPIKIAGEAFIKSLGLNLKEIRYTG